MNVNLHDLLHSLAQRDVVVEVRDGKLCLDAPSGVLDPATFESLRLHKQELLALLSAPSRIATQSLVESTSVSEDPLLVLPETVCLVPFWKLVESVYRHELKPELTNTHVLRHAVEIERAGTRADWHAVAAWLSKLRDVGDAYGFVPEPFDAGVAYRWEVANSSAEVWQDEATFSEDVLLGRDEPESAVEPLSGEPLSGFLREFAALIESAKGESFPLGPCRVCGVMLDDPAAWVLKAARRVEAWAQRDAALDPLSEAEQLSLEKARRMMLALETWLEEEIWGDEESAAADFA